MIPGVNKTTLVAVIHLYTCTAPVLPMGLGTEKIGDDKRGYAQITIRQSMLRDS
jgi:hypothetical protein